MIKVSEAKSSGLIPEYYHYLFDDKCECGSDLYISSSLSIYGCYNLQCPEKLYDRASRVCVNFGLRGYRNDFLKKVIDLNHLKSPIEIFKEGIKLPTSSLSKRFYEDAKDVRERPLRVKNVISLMAIPDFRTKALKIFNGLNDVDNMYPIGLHPSVRSKRVRIMADYGEEIKGIKEIFTAIVEDTGKYVLFAVTGYINGFGEDKEKFIEHLESVCNYEYTFIESRSWDNLAMVISDQKINTEKYREGMERGIVHTSNELLEVLKNV